MKLYFSPGACSLSPHICLREARMPFDLVRVDVGSKKLADGSDYLPVNYKGQVPALELDDGEILTEGPVIVQWIADQSPESGLAPPAGTMARYKLMSWLNHITSELHKNYGPLFRPTTPEEYKPMAKAVIARHMANIDKELADKPYLTGPVFTAADAYLYTVTSWNQWVGIDTAQWPNVVAFMERVAARPSVQEARDAEASFGK